MIFEVLVAEMSILIFWIVTPWVLAGRYKRIGETFSVLAIGSEVHGFKHGGGLWTLKTTKIHSTTSFGGEVKPEASCRKILRYVKNHL
jgi:hypothetical protein